MKKLSYKYIEIEQPVGTIYMGKLAASDIYDISYSRVRTEEDIYGIQRNKNEERIKAIAKYCLDPDAIFPTPVILSGDSKYITFDSENEMIEINKELLEEEGYKFSIVDGQHRLEGIHRSGEESRFILPIMLILDTTPEQDAYLFSIINGNQKPVSKSLVLDLFSLTNGRTVEKVCNYLVKQLNSDSESALYRKIKMLGVKDSNSPNATVSQATISRNLMKYFSKNTNNDNLNLKLEKELEEMNSNTYIFRPYFLREEEQIIYKILFNYFNAMNKAEKNSLNSIEMNYMQKTIGYTTKIQLLRPLYLKGLDKKVLTEFYFENELIEIFEEYKNKASKKINENYGSSDSGARSLYLDLIKYWLQKDEGNIEYITDSDKKALSKV